MMGSLAERSLSLTTLGGTAHVIQGRYSRGNDQGLGGIEGQPDTGSHTPSITSANSRRTGTAASALLPTLSHLPTREEATSLSASTRVKAAFETSYPSLSTTAMPPFSVCNLR